MTRTSHSRGRKDESRGRAAAEAVRQFDFGGTALGPRASWSESLRSSGELVLDANAPMALVWGRNQTVLLNEAWVVEIGGADALGRSVTAIEDPPWPALVEALRDAQAGGTARTVAATGSAPAVRLLPVFGEEGSAAGWIVRALPVPGPRRDWLPALLELKGVGVLDWDQQSDRLTWSPGLNDVLGRPEGRPGPRLDHLVSRIEVDDREALVAALTGVQDSPPEHVVRVAAPDGPRQWSLRLCRFDEAAARRVRVIAVVRDETDLAGARQHLRVVRAELQHRVRNILAVIQSLMRRTARSASTLEGFVDHFQGRLGALLRLQGMLIRDPPGGVDLEMLIREELLSAAASEDKVRLGGPHVELPRGIAQTVSMMLHELTANAVKFGALSEKAAVLEVAWRTEHDRLHITWRETGVPLVSAPSHTGAGIEMLERVLPYETGGHAEYGFAPDGFICSVSLPLPTLGR